MPLDNMKLSKAMIGGITSYKDWFFLLLLLMSGHNDDDCYLMAVERYANQPYCVHVMACSVNASGTQKPMAF